MLTICFGHAGGFVKEPKNGLPCFIELVDTMRGRAPRSRCKRTPPFRHATRIRVALSFIRPSF